MAYINKLISQSLLLLGGADLYDGLGYVRLLLKDAM